MAVVDRVRSVERGLLRFETILLTVMVGLITILGATQVVLRGAFSAGILWADPLVRHLVLWIGFLGGAVAAAEDKHFAPEFTERVLKGRVKVAVQLVAHLFAVVVCSFLARAAWILLLDEKESAGVIFSIGAVEFRAWQFEVILPAGYLLLAVHFLLKCLRDVLEPRS